MVSTMHAALSQLRAGEVVRIRDGQGQTLAVFDGLVWVTQDGDPDDAFIGNGGTFTFDRSGVALVEALEETRLAVLAATAECEATHPTSEATHETSHEKVSYRVATAPDAAACPHVDEAERAEQYLLEDIGVALRLKSGSL